MHFLTDRLVWRQVGPRAMPVLTANPLAEEQPNGASALTNGATALISGLQPRRLPSAVAARSAAQSQTKPAGPQAGFSVRAAHVHQAADLPPFAFGNAHSPPMLRLPTEKKSPPPICSPTCGCSAVIRTGVFAFQLFVHVFYPWSLPVFFASIPRGHRLAQAQVQGAPPPEPSLVPSFVPSQRLL